MAEVIAPAETLDSMPPFADPEALFAKASVVLMPRKRMKVSVAAEKYRFIASGGQVGMWRNSTAPYMVDPMDLTTSREHEAVVFCGPARSAKTAGAVLNTLLHRVVCAPAPTLLLHTDQGSARLFSIQDLALMNQLCPEMQARLSSDKNEDNIYDKRYRGMLLVIGWPTINHLSAKDYEVVLITDYDRMPDNLNGEGSIFALARKRNQTFGSRGITVVESSPGRLVMKDPDRPWKPQGHEAPPTTGILDVFNQGDRRLWYWPCPECGEYFEGKFAHLTWPKDESGEPEGGIEAAASQVTMTCPAQGCIIEPRHKAAMNAGGRWLREGESIDADGKVSGEARRSAVASFWLKGPAAAFQSWGSIARNYLEAEAAYKRTGDFDTLKTITNVDLGEPFEEPQPAGMEVLDVALIKARAENSWRLRTVPAGVRALVITVDVQGRYFDVQVTGFGVGFECWVIDRFQISNSAEPNRLIDPGSYAEDWDLLWPLLERGYPLADDATRELHPLCMLVDSGGAPGVTGNAYRFAAAARRRKISDGRLILLKGDAKVGQKRIALSKVDWQQDGRTLARGLRLLLVSSNEMKDDVAGALRRDKAGPDYVHVPSDINGEWFDQVTAEEKGPKGWARRSSSARNEAFDHMCYARAGVLRAPWRWDLVDWANPPAWAAPLESNSLAVGISGGAGPAPTEGDSAPAQAASEPPRRTGWLNKRGRE